MSYEKPNSNATQQRLHFNRVDYIPSSTWIKLFLPRVCLDLVKEYNDISIWDVGRVDKLGLWSSLWNQGLLNGLFLNTLEASCTHEQNIHHYIDNNSYLDNKQYMAFIIFDRVEIMEPQILLDELKRKYAVLDHCDFYPSDIIAITTTYKPNV